MAVSVEWPAALAYGVGAGFGVYAGTVGLAVILGLLGGRTEQVGDTVIGIVFAWVLGLGSYFMSVFVSGGSSSDGTAATRVRLTALVAVVTVGGLLMLARPLLFATVDPAVARAQGVPVQALEVAFLALLGLAVAQAVQVVGALLLLALVARRRRPPTASRRVRGGRCGCRPGWPSPACGWGSPSATSTTASPPAS